MDKLLEIVRQINSCLSDYVLIVLLVDRLGDNLRMIIDPYSAQE